MLLVVGATSSEGFLVPAAVFTARRNARIASAVLATAIPSICPSVCLSVRLSVTRWYCVKTTARSTGSLHCRIAKCV